MVVAPLVKTMSSGCFSFERDSGNLCMPTVFDLLLEWTVFVSIGDPSVSSTSETRLFLLEDVPTVVLTRLEYVLSTAFLESSVSILEIKMR